MFKLLVLLFSLKLHARVNICRPQSSLKKLKNQKIQLGVFHACINHVKKTIRYHKMIFFFSLNKLRKLYYIHISYRLLFKYNSNYLIHDNNIHNILRIVLIQDCEKKSRTKYKDLPEQLNISPNDENLFYSKWLTLF